MTGMAAARSDPAAARRKAPRMNRPRPAAPLALALALALLGSAPVLAQDARVPASAAEVKLSFAPIVKRVTPAVVNVYATREVEAQVSPLYGDPFFQRFFGQPMGRPEKRAQSSLGSGVLVSADGLIVTNHHVVKDADQVRVALSDKREFDAEIVLKDERTDLAVLRLKKPGGALPFLDIDNSDTLAVGDLVLAVGNPFGVGQTVTQGIVSALARTGVGISDYQFFIQTDAAINPGNSGGALVDMAGKLVGINTAIYSRSGGNMGIGFAIPSNMVKLIVDSARSGGGVRRPWLGATLQSVTADIAEGMGLDRPRGALVAKVLPDSPAAKAGLKPGDLVLAVDGQTIDDPDSFGYRFTTRGIGGTVPVQILDGGREKTVTLTLMVAPESVARDERTLGGRTPFTGATVVNLSPAVAEEMTLGDSIEGVAIRSLAPNSPAARVGFQRGDIIRSVNGQNIATTDMLQRALDARANGWQLEIERDGRLMRLVLR